jgi:hypothetical protein
MSEQRVLLETAAFMDSPAALAITAAPTAGIRQVVRRFVTCAYDDLGKAPRFMDGDDLRTVLLELLPRRFAAKDPLGPAASDILSAYLDFLAEDQVVTHSFELRRALAEHGDGFSALVANGAAHDGGLVGRGKTIAHKVARTGRNDPCPCGSGRKFKKCCG